MSGKPKTSILKAFGQVKEHGQNAVSATSNYHGIVHSKGQITDKPSKHMTVY